MYRPSLARCFTETTSVKIGLFTPNSDQVHTRPNTITSMNQAPTLS